MPQLEVQNLALQELIALIIDSETREYEVDSNSLAATHRAPAKHSGTALFGIRNGYRAMSKMGGSWLISTINAADIVKIWHSKGMV